MNAPLAVDLNSPGSYLTWSIFTVSVANLVLIAVMVAIFGAALLLPFPGRRAGGRHGTGAFQAAPVAGDPVAEGQAATGYETTPAPSPSLDPGDPQDADMWTARARRLALRLLPPGKLLPDRQPAYVASWVYVFGVATLAALGMAIVSGFTIAIGGTDWWHTNPVGHFFNSMHLWSVELFMAFMVIHLWGKFWMAAWRGRRAMTWITGVVAFLASVVECFTGYLSQQNFDSQWIATNGKDAFNAVGVGAFFNLMNAGQMLLWHVVLIPIILIALVGAHVLLVRVRGVSHPLPAGEYGPRPLARAFTKAGLTELRGEAPDPVPQDDHRGHAVPPLQDRDDLPVFLVTRLGAHVPSMPGDITGHERPIDLICVPQPDSPERSATTPIGGAVRAGRDQRAVTVRAHAFSTWATLPACGYPPPGRTGARVARGAVQASRASTWGQGW